MASEPKKPKGILKKPTTTTVDSSAPAASRRQPPKPDPREVAVQHARIIHSRREVEEQIQDSIIELSRFPPSSFSSSSSSSPAEYDASRPAPEDADAFKRLVRLYQPGDYDDLIEERNANGLCGYALCGRARTRVSQKGEFKLVNYGRRDFNIVPKREIEKWCSQRCARRAMYVKVQLNETAAWERAGISSISIDLLEEEEEQQKQLQRDSKAKAKANEVPADTTAARLAKDVENMKIEAEKKAAQDARDLALERGDTTKEKSAKRPIQVTIREKKVMMAAQEPSLTQGDEGHLVLDGYKTKFDSKTESINKGSNLAEAAEKSMPDAEQTDG
ncbi:Rtr1/RPAP2 family-domain-containing protein [Biscogniauxia mediterranea]|nr:Rtr1/RPAP2 family-domain-containing protein [Biscogniauxia mediterranea]